MVESFQMSQAIPFFEQDVLSDFDWCTANGSVIKMHKVLLSRVSGYYHHFFKQNPTANSQFFHGVSNDNLMRLKAYCYGEMVTMQFSEVFAFLGLARELQVWSLESNQMDLSIVSSCPSEMDAELSLKDTRAQVWSLESNQMDLSIVSSCPSETRAQFDLELTNLIKSLCERVGVGSFKCLMCGHKSNKSDHIKQHLEHTHFAVHTFCKKCNEMCGNRLAARRHCK